MNVTMVANFWTMFTSAGRKTSEFTFMQIINYKSV